jgi:hypothetical protein
MAQDAGEVANTFKRPSTIALDYTSVSYPRGYR